MRFCTLAVILLTVACQRQTASIVPNETAEDPEAFNDVRELESLRTENEVKTNKTDTGHPIDSTPEKSSLLSSNEEIEPQPNSRSAIFRHRGITQAKKSRYWYDKPNEDFVKYPGIQYSPADLAEYVFSTGDEEGVAVAVEELVREGMMGRTDAINYLQDVKQMLAYMKAQFELKKELEAMRSQALPKPEVSQRLPNLLREQFISPMNTDKREPKEPETPSLPVVTTGHPHQEVIASTSEPKILTNSARTTVRPKTDSPVVEGVKREDHIIRQNDDDINIDDLFIYEPAHKIIRKFWKDMFTESLIKGDAAEAADKLSKFIHFSESEIRNNRIDPKYVRMVLGTITVTLIDSVQEYMRLIQDDQPQNMDSQLNVFHALLNQNNSNSPYNSLPESFRKLAAWWLKNVDTFVKEHRY